MVKRLIPKLLIGAVLAISAVFGAGNVLAVDDNAELPDTYLQVSPVSTRIDLDPSQQYNGSIKVSNVGQKAFDFKVYASPYNVKDLTYEQSFTERGNYNKIVDWITFDQDVYQALAPGNTVEVPYHINVPTDVLGGGQYAVIFAEVAGDNSTDSSIQTISRVGHTVFATVSGDTREAGELVSAEQKPIYFEGKIGPSAIIKNTGNVDFASNHSFIIESIFGQEVYHEQKNYTIVSGTSRQIDMEWSDTPMIGLFKVTNRIIFTGQGYFDETKFVLVMPIWLMILILLVIAVLILFIVINVKKFSKRRGAKKLNTFRV